MSDCTTSLRRSPLPRLMAADSAALRFFVNRDLLDEDAGPIEQLWSLPPAERIVRKQQADGSWRYPGRSRYAALGINYKLLETFRNLRYLVEQYGFARRHPAIARAARYVFGCQSDEGDIRGILGNQHMPYYHAAILELLIKAGFERDRRVTKGMRWLLSMRQDDGGWIVPLQAIPAKEKTDDLWSAAPILPDRSRLSSHLATGMVLRAFAAHSKYRHAAAAREAGELLKSRLFKADKYNDRKAPHYWMKLQFPFWWTNVLTALDSLSLIGFPREDAYIQTGLDWLVMHQGRDGLWLAGYEKTRHEDPALWVTLAVCRVFKRFCS